MALIASRKRSVLAATFVLAPERYDPRRLLDAGDAETVLLGAIARSVRKVVQPADDSGPWLVLDTSDAKEGIVISRKLPTYDIGSTKKTAQPGDIVVSRLRPYLRQVAYVDDQIPNIDGACLACSTEFYVLRSTDSRSIAFLVPFFLSQQVQEVLAASQEGGHHPRFDEQALLTLPVPKALISTRESASHAILQSVREYRSCESGIKLLIQQSENELSRSS
ncbi:MAG: hypothetical protein WCB27_11510 [Thermoguttaceae bacterium]|jgi:hypothetical protein